MYLHGLCSVGVVVVLPTVPTEALRATGSTCPVNPTSLLSPVEEGFGEDRVGFTLTGATRFVESDFAEYESLVSGESLSHDLSPFDF